MTTVQKILCVTFFLTYLIIAIAGTKILLKSKILTGRQKFYNFILLWTVPIIWFIIVKAIHKRTRGSHEVPIKNDVSSNSNSESGLGAPGAGISNRGY